MRAAKSMLVSALLGCVLTLPALTQSARAQANPSADEIIKSLKPMGTIGTGTRGIRPATGATPPAAAPAASAPSAGVSQPAPARTAAASQPAPAKPPSANLEVQFATNSAELNQAARSTLDQLGKALTSNDLSSYRFRIEGHTDTVGNPELNKSLSARRADAVVAYLNGVYHVDMSRLQAVGLGEAEQAVPTGPQVAEPRNRRVKVVNLGA
jgi:OOP family OmpA-OmpF porin